MHDTLRRREGVGSIEGAGSADHAFTDGGKNRRYLHLRVPSHLRFTSVSTKFFDNVRIRSHPRVRLLVARRFVVTAARLVSRDEKLIIFFLIFSPRAEARSRVSVILTRGFFPIGTTARRNSHRSVARVCSAGVPSRPFPLSLSLFPSFSLRRFLVAPTRRRTRRTKSRERREPDGECP